MTGSEFFSGNFTYIAEVYAAFLQNPNTVDSSWQDFFKSICDEEKSLLDDYLGANWVKKKPSILGATSKEDAIKSSPQKKSNEPKQTQTSNSSDKLAKMIDSYRNFGHTGATLDPLGFVNPHLPLYILEEETEIKKTADANTISKMEHFKKLYCGTIGVEASHIKNKEERDWIYRHYEEHLENISTEEAQASLEQIIRAESFEQQLHTKFPGAKRFSIEGGEGTIVALEQILLTSSNLGCEECIIGMAHRGRLNVLTHTMGKPYKAIFSEFMGVYSIPEGTPGSGDVKYHLGLSSFRKLSNGKQMYLSLTPNPSHLEAVNTVVMGRVRARQDLYGDNSRRRVMPIVIHGDAAMAGQGVVYESFALANLEGYTVGGTIHIAINNQIGFTALQKDTKSGTYCTDIAKSIDCPVFHVNGNDIEGLARIAKLATKYRQQFGKDIVIEIFCYRKYGHNEGDEPMFTQPLMYKRIKESKNPIETYSANFEKTLVSQVETKVKAELDAAFEEAKTYKPTKADWLDGKWSEIKRVETSDDIFATKNTGISQKTFDLVGGAISQVPQGFVVNSKIERMLKDREQILLKGKQIDWATAELLCYGSLLIEGFPVRLSGEDCERGTFSHRHSVYYEQNTGEKYYPLNNIKVEKKAKYSVFNSLLSEFGVLGYEYGYSVTDPNQLNIWEGQFGDFANGAVTIYDQFISSGEDKWLRMSGLVSLLPHGFEGQGPEHSSARLERFLQYCAGNNIIVANCTTPANLFHILRRQVKGNWRKPLIIMSPKSLLRHPLVVSEYNDFAEGSSFKTIIADSNFSTAKKIVFTSGKVYYDLLAEREKQGKTKDIALIRIEQYYPFDSKELKKELAKFTKAETFSWCQEEPKNMGAWHFIRDHLEEATNGKKITYIGRKESASPATGFASVHTKEQTKLVLEALS